jgi:hypothetical protein
MTSGESCLAVEFSVRCRRILLGRAKFLLHIAKGKKGRAAVLYLSGVKSGAQAQTTKVEQNLLK